MQKQQSSIYRLFERVNTQFWTKVKTSKEKIFIGLNTTFGIPNVARSQGFHSPSQSVKFPLSLQWGGRRKCARRDERASICVSRLLRYSQALAPALGKSQLNIFWLPLYLDACQLPLFMLLLGIVMLHKRIINFSIILRNNLQIMVTKNQNWSTFWTSQYLIFKAEDQSKPSILFYYAKVEEISIGLNTVLDEQAG